MKKILFISLAIVLVLSMGLIGCAATPTQQEEEEEEPEYIIRCAIEFPVDDPIAFTLQEMETIVPEETNGRVKFELYPAALLYNQLDAIAALQAGDLEMALGGENLAYIPIPEWDAIAGLPFLFDDYEHLLRFLETDAYKELTDKLEGQGIKTLTSIYLMGGSHLYNSVRPVATLEDTAGLKIATSPTPLFISTIEALGLTALSVPIPELVTSIETGVVDGLHGPLIMIEPFELIRNCPYLTILDTHIGPEGLVVSTEWWNDLPSDLQQILEDLFEDWGERYHQIGSEESERQLAVYEAAEGTTVIRLTSEEKAIWRDAVIPIWDDVAAQDPSIGEIIDAVESVR